MPTEQLKLSAVNFGFDASWIAEILQNYGEDALTLAVEAARNGLSIGLIVEILTKFGPKVLDLLVSWLNQKNMMKGVAGDIVPGAIVVGDDNAFIDLIVQKYLPMIIQQYLPMILEKYGPQIMQVVVNIIMQSLQKN
jgi:hypothetical protein